MIYTAKGEMLDKMIQGSWEVRQVGCRTGGMQDSREAGLEGGRTGRRQDWKDAGKEGFMEGVMQKGGVQER